MDFFCLTIFIFICYLIINLSQIEDKFILVINDDDEESIKATNYYSVEETTAEKNDINILREPIENEEAVKATNYSSVKEAITDSRFTTLKRDSSFLKQYEYLKERYDKILKRYNDRREAYGFGLGQDRRKELETSGIYFLDLEEENKKLNTLLNGAKNTYATIENNNKKKNLQKMNDSKKILQKVISGIEYQLGKNNNIDNGFITKKDRAFESNAKYNKFYKEFENVVSK
ncbi:22980_t:CDS:2 [Gigaspora rosea]|nr:22980_t:CDS:2 [Gigaspora rosea]